MLVDADALEVVEQDELVVLCRDQHLLISVFIERFKEDVMKEERLFVWCARVVEGSIINCVVDNPGVE